MPDLVCNFLSCARMRVINIIKSQVTKKQVKNSFLLANEKIDYKNNNKKTINSSTTKSNRE